MYKLIMNKFSFNYKNHLALTTKSTNYKIFSEVKIKQLNSVRYYNNKTNPLVPKNYDEPMAFNKECTLLF